jgi:hypothetical protein
MKISRLLLAPALAVAIAATGMSAAHADPGNAFDVYAIDAPDVRVNSGGCRSIPVALLHDGAGLEDAYATVEMWRGGTYVEQSMLFASTPGRIAGSFNHCPTFEGLGTFRFGPSDVKYATTDFASLGEFRDSTTRQVRILQDARIGSVSIKAAGKKRTLTAKTKFYDVAASKWRATPKGVKVRVQRQAAGGVWRTVKSSRVGAAGKVRVSVKASKKARYRLTVAAGRQTWDAVSKTVRK